MKKISVFDEQVPLLEPGQVRTQADLRQLEFSLEARISCPPGENVTRGELAPMTDLAAVIARHGGVLPQVPPNHMGGEVDYDVDLQGSLHAVRETRAAWFSLPVELRRLFPTWDHVAHGLASGQLELVDGVIQKKAVGAPAASAGVPAALSSDSATVTAKKADAAS